MSQITKISVDGTVYDLPAGLVSSVNGETGNVTVTADGIGAATNDELSEKLSAMRSLDDLAVYDVPRPKLSIGFYKLTMADGSVPVDDYTMEQYGSVESSSDTDVEQRVVVKYVNTHISSDETWMITVRIVYSRTRKSASDAWGEWMCVLSDATGDDNHYDAGGVAAYWQNKVREYWQTKAPEYDKDTNTYTSSLTSNYYGDATLTFRPEFRAQSPAATGDTLATVKAVSAAASATDSAVGEVGEKVDSVKEKTDNLDTTGVVGLNKLGRSWSDATSDDEETGRQYLKNLPIIGQVYTVLGGDTSGDTVQAIVKDIQECTGSLGDGYGMTIHKMLDALYDTRLGGGSSEWYEIHEAVNWLRGYNGDSGVPDDDITWLTLVQRVKETLGKVNVLTTKVDSVMAKLDSLTTLITDTIAAQKASVASLDKDESSLSDVVTALQSMNGTSSEGGAK